MDKRGDTAIIKRMHRTNQIRAELYREAVKNARTLMPLPPPLKLNGPAVRTLAVRKKVFLKVLSNLKMLFNIRVGSVP